jgi:hypothetical protein
MPDWRKHVRQRLASLRLSVARENEIVDELAQHLDDRWRELMAAGASDEEASRLALAQLRDDVLVRNLARLKQAHARLPERVIDETAVRSTMLLPHLLHDLRYTCRALRRDAGFAVFAILIVGLGIGASATVFSVVNAVLLRPLPFENPAELVWITNEAPTALPGRGTQVGHMLDLREKTQTV